MNNMAFPEKFRALIELKEEQVNVPDYVWLSYAVCATEDDSCGWQGWIIESARKVLGDRQREIEVEADTEQHCPRCGKPLYRTGVEKQFRLNPDAGPKIGYPYRTTPIKYSKRKLPDSTLKALKPLKGKSFRFAQWSSPWPEWTHDHCRGCRAHICGADDNDFHEAYVTGDSEENREWLCPTCFERYQVVLNFKLRRPKRR
jgi:hypothetical protein